MQCTHVLPQDLEEVRELHEMLIGGSMGNHNSKKRNLRNACVYPFVVEHSFG